MPHSLAFPGGQRVVLQTMFFTPEAIGFPLQLIGEDGTVIRSFGADPPIYLPKDPEARYRTTASTGDGRIWLAYLHRHHMELWDTAGNRERTIIREADWFPARYEMESGGPLLRDLRVDKSGLLWTLITVPNLDLVLPPAEEDGEASIVAAERRFDTVIEVIDPATGLLLARHRDGRLLRRFTRDFVYSFHRDQDGEAILEVFRTHLEPTPHQ